MTFDLLSSTFARLASRPSYGPGWPFPNLAILGQFFLHLNLFGHFKPFLKLFLIFFDNLLQLSTICYYLTIFYHFNHDNYVWQCLTIYDHSWPFYNCWTFLSGFWPFLTYNFLYIFFFSFWPFVSNFRPYLKKNQEQGITVAILDILSICPLYRGAPR